VRPVTFGVCLGSGPLFFRSWGRRLLPESWPPESAEKFSSFGAVKPSGRTNKFSLRQFRELVKVRSSCGGTMNTSEITPSGRIVEEQLDCHLGALQKAFGGADALAFVGPLFYGVDEAIRDAVEWIHRGMKRSKPNVIHKRPKLVVLLDTPGGYSQVVERIADCLHKHFNSVEFVIPNRAMSAGTILAMSGDEIWMDYFSVLGPIDPQVQGPKGELIPAHGYLVQYQRLVEKSKKNKITTAELQFLIQKFDPAELYQYEQEMNLSVTLLRRWLVQYKFRNWSKTEGRQKKVTAKMKQKCAESVAHNLNNTTK